MYTVDGLIIYPAAGAGVVYNPLTQTQSFYLEHNDDILCVALNRNPKVVATGEWVGSTSFSYFFFNFSLPNVIMNVAQGNQTG